MSYVSSSEKYVIQYTLFIDVAYPYKQRHISSDNSILSTWLPYVYIYRLKAVPHYPKEHYLLEGPFNGRMILLSFGD